MIMGERAVRVVMDEMGRMEKMGRIIGEGVRDITFRRGSIVKECVVRLGSGLASGSGLGRERK